MEYLHIVILKRSYDYTNVRITPDIITYVNMHEQYDVRNEQLAHEGNEDHYEWEVVCKIILQRIL